MVGSPHSGVLLRRLRRDDRFQDRCMHLSEVRQQEHPSGRGRSRHLVLLCAVAVLHARLAGKNAGAGLFLSDRCAGNVIQKAYGFYSIPFIVLIDKEGCILERYLRGEKVKEAILKARKN